MNICLTFPYFISVSVLTILLASHWSYGSATLTVCRDEMSSGFLFGAPTIRCGEENSSRNLNAVSAPIPFGVRGERTYLTFLQFSPSSFSETVAYASLRVKTIELGVGFTLPSSDEPFNENAHAVSLLPSYIDPQACEGEQSVRFFDENLVIDIIDTQSIMELGIAEWDIISRVNLWINGENTIFALALTSSEDMNTNHAMGIYKSTWVGLKGHQVPKIFIQDEAPESAYDEWKQVQFGQVEVDDSGDSNHDEQGNLVEYALGSDPFKADLIDPRISMSNSWLLSDRLDMSLHSGVRLTLLHSIDLSGDCERLATRDRNGVRSPIDAQEQLFSRMTNEKAGFVRLPVETLKD